VFLFTVWFVFTNLSKLSFLQSVPVKNVEQKLLSEISNGDISINSIKDGEVP